MCQAERYICTIKDRVRSTYRMLPFKQIPRIMVIHLVLNAVFWINALPARDGVTSIHSPQYLSTGRELNYKLHVQLEFGEYIQTHEQHNNKMVDRTMGAICFGPTGNQQGGHWFMSLSTGSRLTRHRWTALPMPIKVIQRVEYLGKISAMPPILTFANRHGREIEDYMMEI